jgi:polyisoprenoid-binding protein YceI
MTRLDGQWYLVSMLGERCNWVQNVRAAHGQVTLRHGRAMRCRLQEIPVSGRPPVLKRYLQQVPGAQPHFPVRHHADITDFAAISARYPVFLVIADTARNHAARGPGHARTRKEGVMTPLPDASTRNRARTGGWQPRRRWRRWRRWILASVVAIVVIIVGAVAAFIKLGPSFAPLALPQGLVSASSGPLSGTWQVADGSLAGFRIEDTALGLSNYVGGQTRAVTGVIAVSGNSVTSAQFRINLSTVKVSGKTQPQLATSLGTRDHPVAVFTLTKPVTLSRAFPAGRTITETATGDLAMNGTSHPVTVTLTARRDGRELQTAGSIQVQFARWGIKQPADFGFAGSLADHGDAEFLLILHRQ